MEPFRKGFNKSTEEDGLTTYSSGWQPYQTNYREKGVHHITIPAHNPIKIGTLSNILKDIASHFEITKEELINRKF